MNKYYALVKEIGDDVEEEVTLTLNGFEITCFAGICPYKIYEGKKYPVSFEFMIFDEYEVEETTDEVVGLEKISQGFSYWIMGKLDGAFIDAGIKFEDEILLSDYGYLNGKFIRLKVDRIDVEFLEE